MRNLTPEMIAEFSSQSVKPALMAELFFDDQTLMMWSGLGDLEWDDKVFVGGGNFIGVSPIEETQDTQAKGIVASLNGIPSSLIALSLGERVRGRPFRMYLGVVDSQEYVATEDDPGRVELEDGSGYVILENRLLDSPYRIFSGLMDVMEFADDGATATIRLSVENSLIIGQRAKIARYTVEDQRKRYPYDKGMEFINQLQDKEIVW